METKFRFASLERAKLRPNAVIFASVEEVGLACGAADTRVAIEVYNTPGRLASCYKISPERRSPLQWAMKEDACCGRRGDVD